MAKRRLGVLPVVLSILVSIPSAYSQPIPSAKNVAEPASGEPVEAKANVPMEIDGRSVAIREEVKRLREERRDQMPYLDRGYIKGAVNRKSVLEKRAFEAKKKKTLEEVIERALEVHTPAKAAKERISLAKRRIIVAGRELLPGGSFAFQLRKGSLSGSGFTGNDFHVTFNVPVFRGGLLWNTFLREKAEYRAAKKEYDGVVNEMVDEVASAYFEYNRALGVLEDKETFTEKAKKQQSLSKQKHDQGLISEIEYLNVESMVGQLFYDAETAEQEFELAKLELEHLLHVEDLKENEIERLHDINGLIEKGGATYPAVTGEVEKNVWEGQALEDFVELAYRHRPELQVEAEKLRAARLEEKIARAAFLPKVDLVMEFGELAEAFTSAADDPPHNEDWRFSLEMGANVLGNKIKYTLDDDQKAPNVSQFLQATGSRTKRKGMEVGLLNGLDDYAESKEAQVKKLEQIVELEKKEQEVIRDVKEAYFDYHKSRIQVESILKRSQYRQRLAQLAEIRLSKAEIEISEYLEAETEFADEREKLHEALADYYKARSRLNKSIGIRDYLPIEERYGL
jgi:outer membrane protein TolC